MSEEKKPSSVRVLEELQKKIDDVKQLADESGASEKIRLGIEELQKKTTDMRRFSDEYKFELEETIKSRPLESIGVIFIAGLILGIFLGTTASRRN